MPRRRRTSSEYQNAFIKHVDKLPLPELGDDRERHNAEIAFTEAELNTIVFALSFVQHALFAFPRLRYHYGATLDNLVTRLRTADGKPIHEIP